MPKTRNIPAYAGKAKPIPRGEDNFRKHPRIRGESALAEFWTNEHQETSPHTRGKPLAELLKKYVTRNIPAYAGKASKRDERRAHMRKHPRIRGEST